MRFLLLTMAVLFIARTGAAAEDIFVENTPQLTTIRGSAFGTSFHVRFTPAASSAQLTDLRVQITNAIATLNDQMSLWDDDSELSRFNQSTDTDWFEVSAATVAVVAAAQQIRDQSDGAFDPTVRTLMDLWSFGPNQRPHTVPEDSAIKSALALVGQPVETRLLPAPALRKPSPEVQLDLNAIAKGYAVDVIAGIVQSLQPQGSMVEIGGEVRAAGTRPGGMPWRIAIEQPVAGTRTTDSYLPLKDAALATSGDYRNYFEVEGQRFSHTIDPRTGRPITHHLASVSVIADDCMNADAWATALMVLGPEAGYNLASEQQLAALFLVRDGESFVAQTTPGFPELIPLKPAMDANWTTFLIAGAVFAIAVAGMAVGVIVSNRRLRGSCGGLSGLKDSRGNAMCDACTTPPEECDEFRKQVTTAASREAE